MEVTYYGLWGKDEAWLLVDSIVQSSGQLVWGMLPLLSGTVRAAAGDSMAKMLAGINNCGHPHAADVARMLPGGPAVRFGTAPGKGTLYQLKVTLRGVSKPPVWRRVLVHADASLGELHQVIIAAMARVERATGRVLAFPPSISPTRIMTEYAQVVDRAFQVTG
jgi:hypothetical protein